MKLIHCVYFSLFIGNPCVLLKAESVVNQITLLAVISADDSVPILINFWSLLRTIWTH